MTLRHVSLSGSLLLSTVGHDHLKSDPEEAPVFVENVRCNYRVEKVFNGPDDSELVKISYNAHNDCLFATLAARATIAHRVYTTQTEHSSIHAYYAILISVIIYYYDMAGIYWLHDYFDALAYCG